MRDLVQDYKLGKIKGVVSEDEINSIWDSIKLESPSLIKVLNDIRNGTNSLSDSEMIAFSEKIKIYSKLTNVLCRFNLRKEIPYYDDKINNFLTSVQKNDNVEEFRYITPLLTDEYHLYQNDNFVFKTNGVSLFHILCSILKEDVNSEKVFLCYLTLRDQDLAETTIKKHWIIFQFYKHKIS